MNLKSLFKIELVQFTDCSSEEQLFSTVATLFEAQKLVTDEYCEALTKRESEFPTGLKTQYLPIALPHTDSKYINSPFVAIIRNSQELVVKQMGDNQEMYTKDFFFLGIKESEGYSQVELLSALMELFMNESFVTEYKVASSEEAILESIINHIH